MSAVKDAAPLPSGRRPDQAQGRWTKVWVRTCRLWQHGHRRTQRRTRPRARHCVQHANHQGYLSNCKVTAGSGPWTRLLPPTLRAEKPPAELEGGLRTQDPGMSPLAGAAPLAGRGQLCFTRCKTCSESENISRCCLSQSQKTEGQGSGVRWGGHHNTTPNTAPWASSSSRPS